MSKQIKYAMFPKPFSDALWSRYHPVLEELVRQLDRLGCKCVDAPEIPHLKWVIANRHKIDVIHLHWPEHYYWPVGFSKLARFVNRVGRKLNMPGLVRFCYLPKIFVFVAVTKLLGLPVVWTIHDLYPHGQTPQEHYRSVRIGRRILMRHVAVLILNCASAEALAISEFGTPKRIVVAPLGNHRKFYPDTVSVTEARRTLTMQPEDIVFLCFGSMRPQRNALGVIQAFKTLPEKNLRLFVAGRSHESLKQSMAKAANGDDRIHCSFELIPQDQVEILFKACDFVIMPGHHYLTSAVVELALAFGRPVIAPRFGCAIDMIGEAGILYDDEDETGLEKAMRQAVSTDLEQYKQLARGRIRPCSWEHMAAQTLEAYRQACQL